jgi:hypothetical protein
MNVKDYLISLIREAHKWQYTDINGHGNAPTLYFLPIQWILLLLSIMLTFFVMQKGISRDFAGYSITALSIFVGLFLSLILMVFDKFHSIDFSKISGNAQVYAIRTKNFFKQFTALTSYSILLALLSLLLLGASMFGESMTISILEIPNLISGTWHQIVLKIIRVIGVCIYRICTIYFLLNFLYITVYALTSMYDYIKSEYDKVKIKRDD